MAITVPIVYAFFLPQISANRPNGNTKIAVANANDCANHPNWTAFMLRSFPIVGNAITTPLSITVDENDVNIETRRI